MGEDEGFVTRKGIVISLGLAGGVVAGAAAWGAIEPVLSILVGIFAAIATMASLHELLPKSWR
jgi:hypothetical protein